MTFRTRFAPSPTGPLHLGHAYSAWLAFDMAQKAGGAFLLRIEDLDAARSRPEWESLIYKDLHWLGLAWPQPVLRQARNLPAYQDALSRLAAMGVTYPCTCSRADIRNAASAPQEGAPRLGPDGLVYPGTCRGTAQRDAKDGAAIRLDMRRALEITGAVPGYVETGEGPSLPLDPNHLVDAVGDVVLARKDTGAPAYHLAVVVDDAAQGITHVVRGADLAEATVIHIVLQSLLGLPHPVYHHHALVRDEAGKRLAKRDDARAIQLYREDGLTPREVLDLARQHTGASSSRPPAGPRSATVPPTEPDKPGTDNGTRF